MQGHKLKKFRNSNVLDEQYRAMVNLTRRLQMDYKQVGMLGERLQAYCVGDKC